MPIRDLYAKIPHSRCKKGCVDCCINMIQFTPSEKEAMGGYDYQGRCPYLVDGKCSIYEKRPFVCRIFGASEILKCDDCTPEYFLTKEETAELIHQYNEIKEKEEKLQNFEAAEESCG